MSETKHHINMFDARVTLLFLLSALGGRTFMIHNTEHSLCLEDSDKSEVLLKRCNLDSLSQQWVWTNQDMLMCIASSKCLSAQHPDPVQTASCNGQEVNTQGLMWICDQGRLISRNTSMLLSGNGQRLSLTKHSKQTQWRSLDEGDICQERLRLRRASGDPGHDLSDAAEETKGAEPSIMTKEQREYLRWFYRTEDPTIWKFVLLGLAFVCLLIGFLLLGMGAMASKTRRKIAKYKAAASLALKGEGEELQAVTPQHENDAPGEKSFPSVDEAAELKAGSIVVTWKDGNTSCLYADPVEGEKQVEQEEVSDAHIEKSD
ncbi:uncharacterized protein KZ484_023403 [Pholidichthys leucotaenia]